MACSDYAEYQDAWLDEAFIDAILCPYQDAMGGPLFTMLVWGTISTSIYIRTGSVLPPTVLSVVIGGVVMSYAASPLVGLVGLVVLLTGGLAPVLLLKRMNRV